MTSPSEGRAQSTQKENHDDSKLRLPESQKNTYFFWGGIGGGHAPTDPRTHSNRQLCSVSSHRIRPTLPKWTTRLCKLAVITRLQVINHHRATQWTIVKSKRG